MSQSEAFKHGTSEHQLWHGDYPESIEHDNGYGRKVEYPMMPCTSGNCSAKFWNENSRNAHVDFRHSESPSRQSQNDEWANDYRGPGEK